MAQDTNMNAVQFAEEQVNKWKADQQKKIREEQRKQSLKDYNNKLDEIAELIEVNIQEHGEDYFMVDILTTYLDVALKLNDVMKTMSSVDTVIACIGDATEFIDDSLRFNESVMDQSLEEKYGWWRSFKARRKARRVVRNNIGRMKQASANIIQKYDIAMGMVTALEGASVTLKKMTKKMSDKNAKRREKKAKDGTPMPEVNEAARKFLEKRRTGKSSDAADGADTSFTTSAPASDTPSTGSLTDGI